MKRNEIEMLRSECLTARMLVRTGIITMDEYNEIRQLYLDSYLMYAERPFIA